MKVARPKFPHISRFFSASIRPASLGLLWAGFGLLVSVNLLAIVNRPVQLGTMVAPVLAAPWTLDLHMNLATTLWDQGREAAAKQELEFARELFGARRLTNNPSVLGSTAAPADLLAQWEQEPTRRRQILRFWEDIINRYPDYRDAYLAAASLAYELGNIEEARSWLTHARTLDPTSPTIQALGENF